MKALYSEPDLTMLRTSSAFWYFASASASLRTTPHPSLQSVNEPVQPFGGRALPNINRSVLSHGDQSKSLTVIPTPASVASPAEDFDFGFDGALPLLTAETVVLLLLLPTDVAPSLPSPES
mgnify:CR=1 FL=1